jgi:flagellar biosynthesis regulator FlaF
MSKAPYAAYQRVQNAAEDARSVEYRLLGQVTAALMDAERDPRDTPKLIDAALWNNRVWSALKIDLLDDANRLPTHLRGKLVSLALWVERETSQILSYKTDLSAVIGINKVIMEGLKPKASLPAQPGWKPESSFAASAA